MKRTIKKFVVGDKSQGADFSPEELELLVYKVAEWFASPECDRDYEDPMETARVKIKECLLGETADGKQWRNASDDFNARVKIKTLYDPSTGQGTPGKHKKTNTDQAKAGAQQFANKATSFQDLSKYRDKMEQEIVDAYPELDTPVHRPNVRRLALLYAQQESISTEIMGAGAKNRKTLLESLKIVQGTIESTMKSLDIYPDQIRKRMDDRRKGSIGDLVAAVDADSDFKEREKHWALTLALQLWWMTQHQNGKGDGPQIHDWEMWHLTRTRPIEHKCECGREVVLVEGFTPEELRDYLVSNGVLVERSVLPNYMEDNNLHGLATFGRPSAPSDDGTSSADGTEEDEDVPVGDGDGVGGELQVDSEER